MWNPVLFYHLVEWFHVAHVPTDNCLEAFKYFAVCAEA